MKISFRPVLAYIKLLAKQVNPDIPIYYCPISDLYRSCRITEQLILTCRDGQLTYTQVLQKKNLSMDINVKSKTVIETLNKHIDIITFTNITLHQQKNYMPMLPRPQQKKCLLKFTFNFFQSLEYSKGHRKRLRMHNQALMY